MKSASVPSCFASVFCIWICVVYPGHAFGSYEKNDDLKDSRYPVIFTARAVPRIYFVPGLGYDESKGAEGNSPYVSGVPNSLEPYLAGYDTYSMTVQGSHGGRFNDMLYAVWRGQRPRANVMKDKRAVMLARAIANDLQGAPVNGEREQVNILATSQGAVSTAHAVIALIERPSEFGLDARFTIDNLVLAGSPVSTKSKLYKKLQELQVQGKIKNIEYNDYQAKGDMVTGLSGRSRVGAIFRGFGYIGKIIGALVDFRLHKKAYQRGERTFKDPHIRAAENKPVDPNSGKKTFGDEIQQRLQGDKIH